MKTEEPSPRRLRKARDDGDSPVSQALGQGADVMVALLLLPLSLGSTALRAAELYRAALRAESEGRPLCWRSTWWRVGAVMAAVEFVAVAVGIVKPRRRASLRLALIWRGEPIEGLKICFGGSGCFRYCAR